MSKAPRGARCLIVSAAIMVLSACTSPPGTSATLLSPAPRECPLPPQRGSTVPPESLAEAMNGHVPQRLPPRFGFVYLVGEAYDALATATWTDAGCREMTLTLWQTQSQGDLPGPKVGPWTVTEDSPGCGNAVLGNGHCLDYRMKTGNGELELFFMGVPRSEADPIALSFGS